MNKGTLTLPQGVAMCVGAVLGSGILILPGYLGVHPHDGRLCETALAR